MTADDSALLRDYADHQDEAAFAELVQRYLNLVYFAALRQVGYDTHRAEEVTQTVFTQLARKASTLSRHPTLAGWLFTTTRYLSSEARRTERRRLAREQEAYAMGTSANESPPTVEWERVRPIIDDTLGELSEHDREAVLLRFFTHLPHAQIGQKLGISENTARMRVERALEKLHAALAKRGITSTATALGLALANQALASAPDGLATKMVSAALIGATKATLATTTTTAATKLISFMSTTKVILVAGGLVSIAAAVITWQQWQTGQQLRVENAALHQQTIALRAEIQQLLADKRSATSGPNAEPGDSTKSRTSDSLADQQPDALTTRRQPGGLPPASEAVQAGMVAVDLAARKSGRGTPVDTARTLLWYLQGGDIKHAADLLTFAPAEKEKLKDFIDTLPENIQDTYGSPARLIAFAMAGTPRPITGVQLLSETHPDDYTAIQHVRIEYKNGEVREDDLQFHRATDGWTEVVSPTTVDRVIASLKKKQ